MGKDQGSPESPEPPEPKRQPWNPQGCTLLAPVRSLIEQAYFATDGKAFEDWQVIWMPDLPMGPGAMTVAHDCRQMTMEMLGGDRQKRMFSAGRMKVNGHRFMMCTHPEAWHAVYVATCKNCEAVFFSSAWDREDTMENYVKKLKGGK